LAKVHFDLGYPDKAVKILKNRAPEFSDSEAIWLTYGNLLTVQQRWEELIEVALLIRHENNPLRDALAGFSYYLEGLGELGRNRRAMAAASFTKLSGTKIPNPVWALAIAEKLEHLGFPDLSKNLLLDLEKTVPNNSAYWVLLAKAAFDLKDSELLVSALAGAYKLRPEDLMIINNYAAALLLTREHSAEALRLTAIGIQKEPSNPSLRINHAVALLQNNREAEAEALLGNLDPAGLSADYLAAFHLARFEVCLHQKRFEEAARESEQIDLQHLLPPEKSWLQQALRQLEPMAAEAF
jgi:predicted Zn-dependent protease